MNLKSLLHHLNRRDHRLLPKNLTSTKIILILLACFTITFSVKTILAQSTENTNTGLDEGTVVSETTTINTFNSNPVMKELSDKQVARGPNMLNSENWGKSLSIDNAFIVVEGLATTDVVGMFASISDGDSNTAWVPSGLIGVTSNAVASLYTPPISGVQYIADSINGFMGKPVYATGFQQLTGIQPLWKICRNAVYTLISVVFVAMGLMIMLRIKISPQATVTIQNSIPKIITTLILVTFSYAIIGLIIDFTYLIQALVLSLLKDGATSMSTSGKNILSGIPTFNELISGSLGTFTSLTTHAIFNSGTTATTLTFAGLTGVVGAVVALIALPASLAVGVIGSLIGVVVGLALLLIFALIQVIKFFFGCAKAYITLLLKIISAPFEIALGAFPNSKMGFSSWLIQTIAYASVFPISLIFLVLLNIILNAVSFNQIWTPGILQGGAVSAYIGGIIGLSGLTILAKLPTLIPEAIFQIKPSPFGKAVGEGFKAYPGHRAVDALKGGLNFGGQQIIAEKMRSTVNSNDNLVGKTVGGLRKVFGNYTKDTEGAPAGNIRAWAQRQQNKKSGKREENT